MPDPITVIKADHTGREVWRYEGVVLERDAARVTLEARFNRDAVDLGYVVFRRGDRFVEHFFTDRWYNVFEVYGAGDGRLKGWYCNVTRPARLAGAVVCADDLALDLFVYPDGRQVELDRDEFDALPITPAERQAGLDALAELQRRAARRAPPFIDRSR